VKKSLKKLNLSRETLRVLEISGLGRVGGNGPGGPAPLPTTRDTKCDYTFSCPELCDPVISADPTCLCA
jgi:hypothetical protein